MNTEKKKLNSLMKKCIILAKKSEGFVSPNPFVGAIVLDKEGNIVGIGRHEKYGEAHAEVNALKMAGEKAEGGTIIVNLEPCSHFGKTPPCADLIIEKGLKKLVVGMMDPNPLVQGRGIEKCKKAGIEVTLGVLEDECKKLNEIFIKNQIKKTPFIAIKTATTSDGKIASKTGDSKWITSSKARNHVQKLRNKYDAILTGSGTVEADNPALNVRSARLMPVRSPMRVLVDSRLVTRPDAKIFNEDGTKVFVAVAEDISPEKTTMYSQNVSFIKCPLKQDKIDLKFLMQALCDEGIRSVIIEAGGVLNGAFLRAKLVDKIYHFIAPKILGDKDAKNWVEGFDVLKIDKSIALKLEKAKILGVDVLLEYSLDSK